MPRASLNLGNSEESDFVEKLDCSKRSVTSFQTYVGQLVQKKQDKIKLLLARALMNEGYLEDFHGQIHANECVFSYPDKNWYGVYLIDENGNQFMDYNGKRGSKFYFQLEFNNKKKPTDANPINGTLQIPDELIVNGEEMKGCIIKPSGKCGNPEKKKKKKSGAKVEEDSDDEETPEEILESISQLPVTTSSKKKMPRDYFEGLGSKSLIIDWMIANMKPGEIFKCIQRGSLSAEDVQNAAEILGELPSNAGPSNAGGPSNSDVQAVINSFTPAQITNMIRVVTKEELISAANSIKNKDQKKQAIVNMCKRSGIKKYSIKQGKKGLIIIEDGEPVEDIHDVLDECAAKEEKRLKKIFKITSISQSFKNMTKEDLMNYQGGNVQLPYSMMTYVKKFFPLIKKYENRDGLLYASIPSEREDDTLYYFKVDDVLGKDLRKLDKKMEDGTVSFGQRRFGFGLRRRFVKMKRSMKTLQNDLKRVNKM